MSRVFAQVRRFNALAQVWRFNALAIAACAVIGILAGGYAVVSLAGYAARPLVASARTVPAAAVPSEQELHLGGFTWLELNQYMWAPVLIDRSRPAYSSKASRSYPSTRNYVFFNVRTGEGRQLFTSNNGAMLNVRIIRQGDVHDVRSPILAILLTYADEDTNSDGRISGSDRRKYAMVAGDGSRVTPMQFAGERLLSALTGPDNTVIVAMQTKSGFEIHYIATKDFSVDNKKSLSVDLARGETAKP